MSRKLRNGVGGPGRVASLLRGAAFVVVLLLLACSDDSSASSATTSDGTDAGAGSPEAGAGHENSGPGGDIDGGRASGDGGEQPAPALDGSAGPDTGGCVRAADGARQPEYCVADEDCLCSTGCNLGRCDAQCERSDDCEGEERCDRFGRCRGEAKLPPADDRLSGGLHVERSTVALLSEDHIASLVVRTLGATQRVRGVAPPGVLIRCGQVGEFGEECEQPVEPGGEVVTLQLRLADASSAELAAGDVRLFGGGEMRSVSIQTPRVEERTPALNAGHYRGDLRLVAGDSRAPAQGIFVEARVDMTAGGREILLVDPARLLFVGGLRVELTEGDDGLTAFVGDVSRLQLDPARADWSSDIALDARVDSVSVGESKLELELSVGALGLVPTERLAETPRVEYTLSLSRVGNLDQSPELSAAAESVLTANPGTRGVSLSVWEQVQAAEAPCPEDLAPELCAQRLLCAQGVGSDPLATAPEFGTQLDDLGARDVLCEDDTPQAAFPLFSSTLTGAALMERCLAELEQLHIGGSTPDGALLEPRECVSVGRALSALSWAAAAEDESGPALAQHLLAHWLRVQTFVLEQRGQHERMLPVLGADADALSPTEFSLVDTLQLAGSSFDVLLHPRVGDALALESSSVLSVTDYRTYFAEDGYAENTRPVFEELLTASLAYASLANRLLRTRCGTGEFNREVDDVASAVSRRTFVLSELARGLQARAEEISRNTPWRPRMEQAHERLSNELSRLRVLLGVCRSGDNPLGIDDVDLPLYFGDAATANTRFSAISDYLVGAKPDAQGAWVPAAIDEAQESLSAARDAWLAAAERRVDSEVSAAEGDRRQEAIRRRYGQQLLSLCGNHSGHSSDEILLSDIDPNRCFVSEGCRLDEADVEARFSAGDMLYDLCVMGKLRQHAGPVTGYGDSNLDELADEFAAISQRTQADPKPGLFGEIRDWYETLPPDIHAARSLLATANPGAGAISGFILDDAAPQSALAEFQRMEPVAAEALLQECTSIRDSIEAELRPTLLPAACENSGQCPIGFSCAASECAPESTDALADVDCFHGALGERTLALRGLATEVDIAKSELAELTERYDIAMRSCMIQKLADEAAEEELAAHSLRMATLRESKRDADKVGNLLGTLTNAASAAATGLAAGPAGAAAMAAAALGAGASTQVSMDLDAKMQQVEEDHELALQRIASRADSEQCFNDATAHLVGARSASLRITRAAQEGAVGVAAFRNMTAQVGALVRDGRAELEADEARASTPLAQNLWVDERIDTYERKVRIAKRATYMAVRAVEYEFQACLDQRADVVSAALPEHLAAVLDTLLATTSTRSIGGRRPSDGLVVLSLKDDILALADRSDFAPGYHALDAEERLQHLLSSPRSAAFDADGSYLGQRIPFSLSPRALQDSASTLASGNACAERLWSLSASVLGAQVVEGGDTNVVELGLEKQNSFYSSLCSQACDAVGQGEWQLASVRPSRNLFLDPIAGVASGVGPASFTETETFTTARLRAHIGVTRLELESDEYAEGDSEELAGRGLWGDYALLIPAAVIQRDDRGGLVLPRVDDVLLRLEYVSVAAR